MEWEGKERKGSDGMGWEWNGSMVAGIMVAYIHIRNNTIYLLCYLTSLNFQSILARVGEYPGRSDLLLILPIPALDKIISHRRVILLYFAHQGKSTSYEEYVPPYLPN